LLKWDAADLAWKCGLSVESVNTEMLALTQHICISVNYVKQYGS